MSLFRKRHDDDAIEEVANNPYLNARRAYNDEKIALVEANRLGKMFMIACLLVTLASVGVVCKLSTQSHLVPYVVEVDKLGQTNAVGRADSASVADERIVKSTLASFVMDARRVSFDGNMQNDAVWRVFSKLKEGDPGLVKMRTYMTDANTSPTKRAEQETVDVEIVTILQQVERNWEITWTETAWNRTGQQIRKHLMRGLFTVYFVPPTSATTEKEIFRNPLGLYVKDFSWGRMIE